MADRTCDLAILGGGLAGGLTALAFARTRPDLRLCLVEQGARFGGEHVWSFFDTDVDPEARALLDPLIAARWEGYAVRFPGYARALSTRYASITSDRLDARLREALPAEGLLCGARVARASALRVELDDGTTITAGAVLDARGAKRLPHMAGGWQTFLGQMVTTTQPHGLTRPIVMDATVEQVNGYRFVYVLPFGPSQLFIEDTYYSDTPAIAREALRERIARYAAGQGWDIAEVLYEETGALPVIAKGDFSAFWNADPEGVSARAGTRAALVHPLTSYSLPDAVRFAVHLAGLDNIGGEALGRICHDWAAHHWREGRFYRMLTTMLFGAGAPEDRWRMLARFYRLPEPLIERFYAGQSRLADMARVLAGKPPVPVGAAVAALAGQGRPLADLSPLGERA